MTDYIIKLSTEQLSGSITYVNSPDPPSSPTLEVENFWRIRLKQRYFIVRESKTEAGENRAVPISRKALPYFQQWMQDNGKTLITDDTGEQLSYHRFRTRFDNVMLATSCHHAPHECRHTCATLLDNAGANDTAVKRILGHASPGVTKGTYTHKSLHKLKKAIDLI